MIVKVKHQELNDVAQTLSKDASLLEDEIAKLLSDIDNLRTVWQGDDATIFCNNVSEYLKKMRQISNTYNVFSTNIKQIDDMYVEMDLEYSKNLEKGVVRHE